MKTREKPGQDWTVALRRQPPRIVDGQPKSGDTSMYEMQAPGVVAPAAVRLRAYCVFDGRAVG